MFINNYYYDLPLDIINRIDDMKRRLEKMFNIGDILIYGRGIKCKYKVLKINKSSYTIGGYGMVNEPKIFIKGFTREDSRLLKETTFTNDISHKTTIKKATLENNAIRQNPISLLDYYKYMINADGTTEWLYLVDTKLRYD